MKTLKLKTLVGLLAVSMLGFSQTAPVASNVSILGEALFNAGDATTLTGFYDFTDADGDSEGVSTYIWYRDIDGDGSEAGEEIAGETGIRYTIQAADINDPAYTIYFEVTPVDNEGTPRAGTAVSSVSGIDPATTTFSDATLSNDTDAASANYLNAFLAGNKSYTATSSSTTVIIYGDLEPVQKGSISILSGATLIVKGQFITKDDLDIIVDPDATFIIESGLDARDGSSLNISGTMTINGNVTVEDDATFTIADGGALDITGNLNLGADGTLNIEGDMTVDGSFDTGTGATITVTLPGTLDITGDLIGDAKILGDGPVIVGGDVDPAINDSGTGQILPIELTYFNAYHNDNNVTISWQTASEENNDYFTIERSTDGINYETVGIVLGAGNSYISINYSYTDNNPVNGVSYYRLKQTDYNGAFEVFSAVSVSYLNENDLRVGPNPAINEFNVMMGGTMGAGTLKLYSITGAMVKNIEINSNYTTIDISDLPSGNYMMVISANEKQIKRKVMIQ